jgi:hypothetical protein
VGLAQRILKRHLFMTGRRCTPTPPQPPLEYCRGQSSGREELERRGLAWREEGARAADRADAGTRAWRARAHIHTLTHSLIHSLTPALSVWPKEEEQWSPRERVNAFLLACGRAGLREAWASSALDCLNPSRM